MTLRPHSHHPHHHHHFCSSFGGSIQSLRLRRARPSSLRFGRRPNWLIERRPACHAVGSAIARRHSGFTVALYALSPPPGPARLRRHQGGRTGGEAFHYTHGDIAVLALTEEQNVHSK